jgi:predicted nuclease of predicted toxin-antitoxin system
MMNLPRALGRRLAVAGHACRHVADIGSVRAPDAAIVEEARRQGEVILTHDLDYGHLLAFSGQSAPSVVILRLRNTHPDHLFAGFAAAWPEIERPLTESAIVILEDGALRIRRLPIEE